MNTEEFNKDRYDQILKFSRITTGNWLAPDRKDYIPTGVAGEQWIEMFLRPQLSPHVPAELKQMFEIARGSIIYSWFFHPLATLGFEQCTRIAESAVFKKCAALKLRPTTFEMNIDELVSAGVIAAAEQSRWHAARRSRNDRSHAKTLLLIDPSQAASQLQTTAELLNSLFTYEVRGTEGRGMGNGGSQGNGDQGHGA